MSIGDLRERVTLQAKHRATDGGGGFSESWSDVATVWASLDWSPGGEALSAGRIDARPRMIATIRARADLTSLLRLLWKGRVFGIASAVAGVPECGFVQLHCIENEPS